ncbi:MAG: site-specific integrase [Thermodesulfobacteriota bacterium]|jgi:integrase
MVRGIYKRGNVYWIRYAGLDGRIIRESSHSPKLKEAGDLLIGRRNEIKEGRQPEVRKRIVDHTFYELAEQYLKWAERQRSFQSKKSFVEQLTDAFGTTPLRQFSSMLLEQYQTERLQRGNKPATANRLLATLKHMFTKAVEWEMVEEGTLKRIRKAKLLEENNRRLRYLSIEECQSLLNACDFHLRPIVICGLHTGMRKGEILGLTWDRVDFNNGFILLDRTKNGERREIPIDGTLRETLLGLFHGTKERPRRIDVNHVFYDPATEKSCRGIERSFPQACRRAKITDFHFHDLRHTFASHLIMSGQDITTVKELLGHKTLTMTLRYAHLAPSHKVKAVEVLDSVLTGKSTAQLQHNSESVGQ